MIPYDAARDPSVPLKSVTVDPHALTGASAAG